MQLVDIVISIIESETHQATPRRYLPKISIKKIVFHIRLHLIFFFQIHLYPMGILSSGGSTKIGLYCNTSSQPLTLLLSYLDLPSASIRYAQQLQQVLKFLFHLFLKIDVVHHLIIGLRINYLIPISYKEHFLYIL